MCSWKEKNSKIAREVVILRSDRVNGLGSFFSPLLRGWGWGESDRELSGYLTSVRTTIHAFIDKVIEI